jgi:hypothetical protein
MLTYNRTLALTVVMRLNYCVAIGAEADDAGAGGEVAAAADANVGAGVACDDTGAGPLPTGFDLAPVADAPLNPDLATTTNTKQDELMPVSLRYRTANTADILQHKTYRVVRVQSITEMHLPDLTQRPMNLQNMFVVPDRVQSDT